jgi:hypothetical protein
MDKAKITVVCFTAQTETVVARLGGDWLTEEEDERLTMLSRLFDDWTDLQPILDQLRRERLLVEWHSDWVGVTEHVRVSFFSMPLDFPEKE